VELFVTDRKLLEGLEMPLGGTRSPRDVLDRRAVKQGMPFILDGEGGYDVRLNRWLAELPDNGAFSRHSWMAYARDLLIWVRWLADCRDDKSVWDADEEDFRAFFFARCHSDDPGERVATSTWARQRTTLTAFYEYAVGWGYVARNPCRRRGGRGLRAVRGHQGLASSSTAPPSKHLGIPTYLVLREVGMRGRREQAGNRRPVYRRNAARNAAAANLVVSTGLRLEEFSLLLRSQVLDPVIDSGGKVVTIQVDVLTAKGNRERKVELPIRYLHEIAEYVEIERAVAVSRAQRAGRYRTAEWKPVRLEGARVIDRGRSYPLARLDNEERMRLLVDAETGVEPAALWLNEDGVPMGYEGWKSTMRSATRVCSAAGHRLDATWHTLRHTFAVHTLAWLLELVFGPRAGHFDPARENDRVLMLDPIRELQRRMGHTDFRTTWNWYLANAEPARRLVGRAVERFVEEIAELDATERSAPR
jgi:site-specific recombinase XerD